MNRLWNFLVAFQVPLEKKKVGTGSTEGFLNYILITFSGVFSCFRFFFFFCACIFELLAIPREESGKQFNGTLAVGERKKEGVGRPGGGFLQETRNRPASL